MATSTRAEVLTQIKNRVKLFDQLERFANSNTANWIDLEDAVVNALTGDAAEAIISATRSDRSKISEILSPANVRASLAPLMSEFMTAIGKPHGSFAENMVEFRDNLEDYPDTVKSRDITFDTSMTATGTGDGTLYRCTVDVHGNNLEGGHVEAKIAECVLDQQATDEQEELFVLSGEPAEIDFAKVAGSGIKDGVKTLSARDAQPIITNPSFSTFTGTAPTAGTPTVLTATDEITGWIVDTAASFEVETDTTYRTFPGETSTPIAVRFKADGNISQILQDNRKPSLAAETPYLVYVALYREASADGNFVIDFGGATLTTDITTLNNAAWNVLTLTFDSSLFRRNFTEQDLDIKFTKSGSSIGTIILDDVIVNPMQLVDGTYAVIVGGATAFLEEATIAYTDTEGTQPANRGVLQYWLSHRTGMSDLLGFGFALPSAVAATQVTAAAGRTLTFADANPDTITASTGSFVSDGYAKGMALTVAGTASNNGTYTIQSVTALVLTLIATDALAAEGPLSGGQTLNATFSISES